jgi:hypothetical protein
MTQLRVCALFACLSACTADIGGARIGQVVSGPIYCDAARPEAPLVIESKTGEFVELQDFEFGARGSLVPSVLACNLWILNLAKNPSTPRDHKFMGRILMNPSLRVKARLIGVERSTLYRECSRSDLCRVRFPYSIHPKSWARWFDRSHDTPIASSRQCLASTKAAKESPKLITEEDLQPLELSTRAEFSILPEVNLADIYIRAIKGAAPQSEVVVATMGMNTEELKRLADAAALRRQKLFVLFNAELVWTSSKLKELVALSEGSNHLLLAPMFNQVGQGLEGSGAFHKKGLAEVSGLGNWVFSSANLQKSSKSKLAELVIIDRSQPVANALAQTFATDVQRLCENQKVFECYLNTSFNQNDPQYHLFHTAFTNTCAAFERSRLKAMLDQAQQKIFAVGPTTQLRSLYQTFLERSQHTHFGVSHKVGDAYFLDAVAALKARNLKVDIVAEAFLNDKALLGVVRRVTNDKGQTPHSKFLIRDQSRILWGTPNFTTNGLTIGAELAFVSDSAALIKKATEFYKSWVLPQAGVELDPDSINAVELD